MKNRNHNSMNPSVVQVPHSAELDCEIDSMQVYRSPELFALGKATNLLQGGGGAYYDSDGSYSQNCPKPWPCQ